MASLESSVFIFVAVSRGPSSRHPCGCDDFHEISSWGVIPLRISESLLDCVVGAFAARLALQDAGILPEEIDSEQAQAKVKDGVLVLKLPLKGVDDKKVRMSIQKVDNQ